MRPNAPDPNRRPAGLALRLVRCLVLCLVLGGGLALPAPAWARSEKTLAYPRDQVWPAAVRFLVVDEHVKITDKDPEAGYVIFELRDGGKPFRGALEVVTVTSGGRSSVRFVLQIADRPSYVELAMLARLEDKLRAELGSPQPPPSPKEPAPPKQDEPSRDAPGGTRRDDGPPVSPTP